MRLPKDLDPNHDGKTLYKRLWAHVWSSTLIARVSTIKSRLTRGGVPSLKEILPIFMYEIPNHMTWKEDLHLAVTSIAWGILALLLSLSIDLLTLLTVIAGCVLALCAKLVMTIPFLLLQAIRASTQTPRGNSSQEDRHKVFLTPFKTTLMLTVATLMFTLFSICKASSNIILTIPVVSPLLRFVYKLFHRQYEIIPIKALAEFYDQYFDFMPLNFSTSDISMKFNDLKMGLLSIKEHLSQNKKTRPLFYSTTKNNTVDAIDFIREIIRNQDFTNAVQSALSHQPNDDNMEQWTQFKIDLKNALRGEHITMAPQAKVTRSLSDSPHTLLRCPRSEPDISHGSEAVANIPR